MMSPPELAEIPMLTVLIALTLAAPHNDKDHAVVTPDDIKWVDAPPSLPPGAKVAILEGDPTKEGHFVMRAKMPDGYKIMPHTHPKDERVTVLSGTLYLGMGEKFDEKSAKGMPAGSTPASGEPPKCAWPAPGA